MQRTLEACPFCSAKNVYLLYRARCVECEACGAKGPVGETTKQGARLWNKCRTLRSGETRTRTACSAVGTL